MARQVLPIVGAAVGFYFGGPQGAQWGYAIGSVIGNAVDPLQIAGPKIGDNGIQTSAEGAFRPIVYGTGPVVGNVICRGNRQIKKKKQKQSKGGPVTITEHVYWTFAIRISEPVSALLRIWEDEKLVYDVRPGSLIPEESVEYFERFRFYTGSEAQMPDPDLEVFLGMGNVPAYRGTAYIVFPNYDLTDRRESIPNYRFEVASVSEGEQGIRWMMNGDFLGPDQKISPDGFDWSSPPVDGPSVDSYHLSTDGEVLGVSSGSGGIHISHDFGDTWSSLGGRLSAGVRNTRAAKCGGNWFIADAKVSVSDSFNTLKYDGAVISNMGWPSYSLASTNEHLFSAYSSLTWNIEKRDQSGGLIETIPFRSSAGNVALTFGDDKILIQFVEDGDPKLSYILPSGGPSIPLPCPFSGAMPSGGDMAACYSEAMDLWVLFFGTQVAYGQELEELVLAVDPLPERAAAIDEDGEHFVIVGFNRMCISYTGGDTFTPLTVADTNPDSFLRTIVAMNYAIEHIGEPVALSSIVSSIHDRANQPASKFDVTELTDMVYGVVLAGEYTCSGSILTIIAPYFADASEFGKKINYVKRGKPVVKTLTIDDLVDEPEDTMRDNQIEYPAKLHMFFQNPLIGYAPAKASTTRSSPDILVVGERTVQIPVVIDSVDEAAQISDKFMKTAWAEAGGTSTLTITDEHMDLVNADTVGVFLRGQIARRRIVKIEDDPGTRKLTLHNDRQSAVTSNVTGIPLPDPTPPLPSIAGISVLGVLDIPALTDQDDDLHYLTAVTGQTEGWSGAEVQRRLEGSTEFSDIATFNTNTAMGLLLEDVADASEFFTDTTNTLRIQLYLDDEIDSITQEQFLSEGNGCAVQKDDGSWEVMQFRDALDEGDGIYTLSYLQRGRLNSGTSEHSSGQLFVLFDYLRKVPAVSAWLETDLTHRAVSFTTSPESAPTQTGTYLGRSQMEFPVASFTAERVGDTITGTIVPRHRFGTEDSPVRSINWAGYEITASATGQTETIISMTEDFSIDVVGFSSPVLLTISQLNRFPIQGPTVSESIS